MLLYGSPSQVSRCLDYLHEGDDPSLPYLFRPETTTQLGVRSVDGPGGVAVRISTEEITETEDHRYLEFGRVGVLFDDLPSGGRTCVILLVHNVHTQDALHPGVAEVILRITRGMTKDVTFASLRNLMSRIHGEVRARVTMLSTADGGLTWMAQDVTRTLNDFLILEDDIVTVRSGRYVAQLDRMSLYLAIINERPAADSKGLLVEEDMVLVHFTPPEVSRPCISLFSAFTGFTTVIGANGEKTSYEGSQGCLVLNRRATSAVDASPYTGIWQSGDRYFGVPLSRDDVRLVEA